MKHLLQILLLLFMSLPLIGCSPLAYFMIAGVETSVEPPASMVTDEPPAVVATQDDAEYALNIGSYCWTGVDSGVCVDRMPPSYSPEQFTPLAAGTDLTFQFAEPFPPQAAINLYIGSDLTGEVQETVPLVVENGQFVWTIPATSGQFVLMLTARWEGGDAYYTMPITIQ